VKIDIAAAFEKPE